MTFYYFENGERKGGPINAAQLKTLAATGVVTPKTEVVEIESGKRAIAGKISGLRFQSENPKPSGLVEIDERDEKETLNAGEKNALETAPDFPTVLTDESKRDSSSNSNQTSTIQESDDDFSIDETEIDQIAQKRVQKSLDNCAFLIGCSLFAYLAASIGATIFCARAFNLEEGEIAAAALGCFIGMAAAFAPVWCLISLLRNVILDRAKADAVQTELLFRLLAVAKEKKNDDE